MNGWEKWYRYTDNTRARYLDPEGRQVEQACLLCGASMISTGQGSLERMMFGERHEEGTHADPNGQLRMVWVPWR